MKSTYLFITWQKYHDLSLKLAAMVLSKPHHQDHIVAISRGGLTLGHILTDLLQIPLSVISAKSYQDINSQGSKITIKGKPQARLQGKNVLLVDDVADTGKTLKRSTSYLLPYKPKAITTLTMHYKQHSVITPDYYAQKTEKWIIYPYEIVETITSIDRNLSQERKTTSVIQAYLRKIGFSDTYIDFVYKHHIKKTPKTKC